MTEASSDAARPDEPADSTLPTGTEPPAGSPVEGKPPPESERQIAETIRSISRLEESN